jgi:hypothetical protein
MGQVNQPSNLLDRIKQVETQVARLWKSIGLSSATIAAGGLTLLNNAFVKMLDPGGNLRVYIGPDDSGQPILQIQTGTTDAQRIVLNPNPPDGFPAIELYDDTGSTDHLSISQHGNNSWVQRVKNSDGSIDGGKIGFFGSNSALFGAQDATSDSNIRVDAGAWSMVGAWAQDNSGSNNSAVFVGNWDVNAASATISWGPSMASRMSVITDIFFNAATINSHNVDALSPSGFGVRWNPSGAVRLMYLAFRINQAW